MGRRKKETEKRIDESDPNYDPTAPKPCPKGKKRRKYRKYWRPKKMGPYIMYTPLIDTRNWCGFTYEKYVEECGLWKREPEPQDSSSFILWLNKKRAKEIDGFFDRLTWCHNTHPAIVTGTIGMLDGSRVPIKPMWFDGDTMELFPNGITGYRNNGFKKAVIKCVRGMDDFRAWLERGALRIECWCGKEMNEFSIRGASVKAQHVREDMIERGRDLMDLEPKSYWFTSIIRRDLDISIYGDPIINPKWIVDDKGHEHLSDESGLIKRHHLPNPFAKKRVGRPHKYVPPPPRQKPGPKPKPKPRKKYKRKKTTDTKKKDTKKEMKSVRKNGNPETQTIVKCSE